MSSFAPHNPVRLRIYLLLFLCFTAGPRSHAQTKVAEMIRQLDKQRFDAQVAKDTLFLEKVLATDLVYHHSGGLTETKRDFIHHTATRRWNYTAIDVEQATVRVYRNTAVVTGKARMVLLNEARPTPSYVLYTSVYVKHRWLWQLASWSATPITP